MKLVAVGALGSVCGFALAVLAPVAQARADARAPAGHTVVPPKAKSSLVLSSANASSSQGSTTLASRGAGGASAGCPANMVEVEGDYCPALEQRCLRYLDPEGTVPRRCAEFAPSSDCRVPTVKKHYCIDRYEYPNRAGDKPVVMKTWREAEAACKAEGKRMCGGSEWTMACEGRERLPYPYGHKRDADACNIDRPHPDPNEKALADPARRQGEVDRLWQGEASGSRAACVSPYGVHDMTGNVDEWVVNESGHPYKSGSKGGYWGPVRDRCRPMTTAHNEDFAFYQLGFRCCSDAR